MHKRILLLKLQGGLGNQLFQYATAKALSLSHNYKLVIDISSFKHDPYCRSSLLKEFNVKAKIISKGFFHDIVTPGNRFYAGIKRLNFLVRYTDSDFKFRKDLCKKKALFQYLDGYWQSELYFNEYKPLMRYELTQGSLFLKEKLKKLGYSNLASVHIRRLHGTYFTNEGEKVVDDRYGLLSQSYYEKAVSVLRNKDVNIKFLVFSDDIDWCKKNLTWADCFVSDLGKFTDVEELLLMSGCDHHIIANSTYSWWGAWLGMGINKIVICPAKPFTDSNLHYQNYYPATWIQI